MRIIFYILALTLSCCSNQHNENSIYTLDLSDQKLQAIPDSVFIKSNLTELDLGSKNITIYPPLSVLVDTNANQLTEIPESIGKLTKLQILNLNANRLKKLPASITSLTNLESLDISLNPELDIMRELNNLRKLDNLKVLKIAGLPFEDDSLLLIKKSLSPKLKIISSIEEYAKDFK